MTRIQSEVNVPFVRFKEYVDDLQRKRLVDLDLRITDLGLRYTEEYRRVRVFLETFGLTDRGHAKASLPVEQPQSETRTDPRRAQSSDKTSNTSQRDEG